MFENRTTYRRFHRKKGLMAFDITVKETNLNIQADTDLSQAAVRAALKYRQQIEAVIRQIPEFGSSLVPLEDPGPCPAIVSDMLDAGRIAGVGPMAAVAGAVAEYVGRELLGRSKEVVVENGGDIFIRSRTETVFTVFAGNSPLSMKAGIWVAPRTEAFSMCTSSGTLGHSKSFGKADAVSVLARSCALADAAATSLANRVSAPEDIPKAIQAGRKMPGIQGIVIILGHKIGLWGDLQLVRL